MIPRTEIIRETPPSGHWSGLNSLLGGIKVYALQKNAIGVWAQEYWEWWRSARNVGIAVACVVVSAYFMSWLALLPVVYAFYDERQQKEHEIFSHAITVRVGKLYGYDYEDRAINSLLTGYDYITGYTIEQMRWELASRYTRADRWARRHQSLLDKVQIRLS